ncbi:MAG: phenylalanine--tRNA ligase subunit beta [Verrucomicrobiota bacterium]|nr:phenylalanine--tRNA ligase subunit beta [Verrucomicrobiota bacterium]
MKINLDWLSEYVDLPNPAEELVDVLPMLGIEVEENDDSGTKSLENVVVGEVLEKSQHPEADRLSVCSVEVGAENPAQIVCGATNFKPGDRVPVALPGAKLPGGFKIKKSKLRGVTSEGMMCSAKELELGDDDAGLFLLSGEPEIGQSIADVFAKSTTLELEITANRGDCLSHIGVAREVSAYYQNPVRIPQCKSQTQPVDSPNQNCLLSSLQVESTHCPYYTLWSIKGVKIEPSPDWLIQKIESIGLRPINNVVDITNFVLHETGQPLHAFDLKKISGSSIIVREAREGEKITTLDDQERELNTKMMVIADSEKPLVVAGIMGSVDAEVDDTTTDIVLESAWFHPGSVRATARSLGLHTDSSQRFSRDVDPQGVKFAAERAIDLILEIAGGKASEEYVSIGRPPRGSRTIEIESTYVEDRCGFEVNSEDLISSWQRLGFSVEGSSPIQVTVPSYRSEVDRPIDLVEEFLRIRGTADLQGSKFLSPSLQRDNEPAFDLCDRAVDNLIGQGYQEVCNYSLRSANEVSTWFPEINQEALALGNPLTADHTHIRPSLLPGLIEVLAHNQRNLNSLNRVFEIGKVFIPGPRGNTELVSIAWAQSLSNTQKNWKEEKKSDFFDLKNSMERLLHASGMSLPKGHWQTIEDKLPWQSGYAANLGDVHKNKLEICIGTLQLNLTKKYDLKGAVLAVEILIDSVLLNKKKKSTAFSAFSTFPPAIKDLALVVEKTESSESVREKVEEIANQATDEEISLDPVAIFDVFEGKGLPDNMKSIAFTIRMRAKDRTMGEKEINKTFEKILETIDSQTKYELRK